MKSVLAIDPGPEQSAWIIWDGKEIVDFNLTYNDNVLLKCGCYHTGDGQVFIEEVQCYGMPVGKSIFETVFWSGRFCEAFNGKWHKLPRREVKLHLCQQVRAKDSNVTQALVDRFAPYTRNKGKGTKKEPGFFFGFKKDIWQAFALAVTWWDQNKDNE